MSAPTARNMRLLAQHPLDGFGNCGEGHGHPAHARQAARAVDRPRVGAQERDRRRRDESTQADGARADRPAPRADALELTRPGGRPAGRRLPDAGARPHAGRLRDLRRGGSGQAALDRVLRRLRPGLARRPPPVVRRRRVRAHGGRRRRLHAAQPQGRPVLPHRGRAAAHSARRRSGAGGCRARATATPSRRRRGIRRSTPAIARTTPTSIPSAPTARGSAISTAAPSSSTSPTRPTRDCVARWDYQPPFPGFCHTLLPLLDRGLLVVSDESVRGRGQGLAQARVDSGRPRRDQARCRSAPARCHR